MTIQLTLFRFQIFFMKDDRIMAALDDLKAAVRQQTSVDASAVTLIQGIAQQLSQLPAGNDQALKDLTDQLNAAVQPLAQAVAANTPTASGSAPQAGSPANVPPTAA